MYNCYFLLPIYGVRITDNHEQDLFNEISEDLFFLKEDPGAFQIVVQVGKRFDDNPIARVIDCTSRLKLVGCSAKQAALISYKKNINLGGNIINFSGPILKTFGPWDQLQSNIVVFNECFTEQGYLDRIKLLYPDASVRLFGKREKKVGNIQRSGFGVEISNITHDESIRLQMFGMGSFKHLGCGVFDRTKNAK